MKKKIIHNSKRCPDCNHTIRWVRTDNLWKCLRCPSEFTDAELKSKKPYSDEPDYIETNPLMQMFNKPASQVMAPVIPVVTASPITAPLPVATAAILEEVIEDIKVSEPLANNQNLEDIRECVDIDQLFLFGKYRPEEKRTSPTRMQMPTMAAPAQRAEAPTFDTGRNQYSLRSER